ncbi:MFS transporter [Sphingomonas oryzagri]|uniref:MFS transporter n=1 Tax=Sphingomonas oryzagri TaxID=3042314 RepID=A0ABT6N2J3_9SPHN|nr:MFS transporter [Sphingomonas oryzagri]MDH7639298.1 MFS transporter [Sphingomonas oryzagri]
MTRENEARPDAARRWAILVLLGLGAMLAFVSRTNMGAALALGAFTHQFGLTDVGRGWLNSAFFWSYAALQIPMGWVVDRYGVKWPYAIGFILWCIATAACGMMTALGGLVVVRLITGAGEAIVIPASYRWIRSNFAENESGIAVGIYMLGTKVGSAIGTPLAAWLIVAFSWPLMFILIGLIGLFWLLPWLVLVRASDAGAGPPPDTRSHPHIPFANIMKSPMVWGSIIINFCYNYFVFYCMTWMPAYLVERRHLSLNRMGFYSFFSFMGIALVALVSSWIADEMVRRGRDPVAVRKGFVIAGFVIACTELLGATTNSIDLALFWAVISLSGLGLATANHLTLCRLTLIPEGVVGLVAGVQNVSTSVAGIVAPILTGWLKQTSGGYEAPMTAIFFFLVLGAVSCLVLLQRKWAPVVPEAVELEGA